MHLLGTQHGVCSSPTDRPLQTVLARKEDTPRASQCRQRSPAHRLASSCRSAAYHSTWDAQLRRPWPAPETRCDTVFCSFLRQPQEISAGTDGSWLACGPASARVFPGAGSSRHASSAASASDDGAHGGAQSKQRLAVFVSGGGSNMRAIHAATLDGRLPASIEVPALLPPTLCLR
jgi:hypothetical protein